MRRGKSRTAGAGEPALARVSKKWFFFRYLSGFLIPILFTSALTATSTWYISAFVREKNAKIADNVVRQLRADLDEMLHETDLVILSYATDLEFFKKLRKIFDEKSLSYDELQLLRAYQGTVDISAKIRPYIHSIYCCPDTAKASAPFMVSMDGVCSLQNYPDREFIASVRAGREESGVVVRNSNGDGSAITSVPVISKYRLVKSVDGRRAEGILIINLDRRYMENRLNVLVEERGDYLFLVTDIKGEAVLESAALKKLSGAKRDEAIANTIGRRSTRIGGVEYIPVATLASPGGFAVRLLSSRPALYAAGERLITANLLVILLSIAAGVAIIVVVTRKKYDDIAASMNYLDDIENTGSLTPPGAPPKRLANMDVAVAKPLRDYVRLHLSERELRERKLELDLLRSQLNPHFLLNTLQMLNWKIMRELKGYSDLNLIVENLSKILSYSIFPTEKLVRLEDEIKYTDAYVALQEYSRESKIVVGWSLDESMKEYLVPRLTFQPVIENAYKHAFPREAMVGREPRIDVRFRRQHGDLQVRIADNGIGMTSETLAKVRLSIGPGAQSEGGIGLSNTNKRLQLLFGKRFGMQIESQKGVGTAVTLTIPMLVRRD